MNDYAEIMGELVEMGVNTNPVNPYTACFIDPCQQILVTTCNAVHISPLFTAENLALHMLTQHFRLQAHQPLTLVTTCEPDNMSLSALHYAKHLGITVQEIVFGATREDIKHIWGEDPNFPFSDHLQRFNDSFTTHLKISGPLLRDDCKEAFQEGFTMKQEGVTPVLPLDLEEFWMPGDWLLDD